MEAQLDSLHLTAPTPPGPPTYPAHIDATALTTLGQDPRLPDFLKPFLPLLTYNANTADEQVQDLLQDAYTSLVGWITTQPFMESGSATPNPGHTPAPAKPPARSPSPAPDRFVTLNGRQYYRSSQGRLWDTAQPPPNPCRRCHALHWNFTPCPIYTPPGPPNWQGGERLPYAPH